MVNAGDFISPDYSVAEVTSQLFPVDADASVVEWVRFAFHFDEVATVKPAITELVSRGYKVGANLMQISEADDTAIAALFVSWLKQGHQCSILPNSLGTLKPDDVSRIIKPSGRTGMARSAYMRTTTWVWPCKIHFRRSKTGRRILMQRSPEWGAGRECPP